MSMFNGTTQAYLASLGNASSSSNNMPYTIIYPNKDGTTGGAKPNYTAPVSSSSAKSDPYGGVPINISLNSSDSSAKAIQSLSGTLGNAITGISGISNALKGLSGIGDTLSGSIGSGFQGLMDIITQNANNNNAYSASQAQKQMDFQSAMNKQAMEFNSLEAAKNRDWQTLMSNTAHQREVADLQAAGLNPVLSASGGNGASVGSGATASGVTSAGAKGDTDTSANSVIASLYGALISAQTQMYNADLSARTNLAIADRQVAAQMYGNELAANVALSNAQTNAEASKYAAGTAYAASAYNADMQWKNNEAQRAWNAAHPSNAYQTGSSLLQGLASATGFTNGNSVSAKARNELSVLGRLKNKIFG